MEHTPSKTSPKDFFLWAGAIIALYGSITSFLTLIFQYIDFAYPDPLAGWVDPYSTPVRVAMATLIVLTPTFIALLLTIRRDIVRMPEKAGIWVRRWALMLTVFLGGATAAIDLITLVTTLLGGEITIRFALKAIVVLLLAVLVMIHFLVDLRGYWTLHRQKVDMIGAAVGVLALATIAAGFFIIGSPSHIRALRYDEQRVSDLQSIQYQVVNYWQLKRTLPESLDVLNDPLQGYVVPTDTETGAPYEYTATGKLTFSLCATFSEDSTEASAAQGRITYPTEVDSKQQNFSHTAGHVCFDRTIDPQLYPAITSKAL